MRMLQGTGCRLWFDTILEHIKGELKQSEGNSVDTNPEMQSMMAQCPTSLTPNEKDLKQLLTLALTPSPINNHTPTAQKRITKSKSPGILSTVSKAIFGTSIHSGILKLGKELKKAEKIEKKRRVKS
ncbi:hypothetical protein ACF0H5_002471 [Mactra antiquata]